MTWSTDTRFPDHQSAYGIGLHPLPDGRLICVYRSPKNGTLRWTRWEDERWLPEKTFPNHHSANGASLAAYGGMLRCVHRGGTTDDRLWMATYDRYTDRWGADTALPDARCSRNPAIATFQDRLYCVHRGWQTDDALYYTYYDGHGWLTDTRIPGEHFCYGDVALAVFKDKLYCVHSGRSGDDNLWVCWFDGTRWSDDQRLPDHHTAAGTARATIGLAASESRLYCVHKGKATDGSLWQTDFNGETWSADTVLSDGGHNGTAVALTISGNTLVCVHEGFNDNDLWYTWRTL